MTDTRDPDEELLQELRVILENNDPMPSEVTEFAKAAIGWRRIDAELAELLADTVLDADSTLVRSAESARRLTFRSETISIDLEVHPEGAGHRLLGQLAPPPAGATVEVQAEDGEVLVQAEPDGLGRFRIVLPAGGRIRLRVIATDPPGQPVETSWLSL